MPSFTYTRDIPFSTNNPSNDQPIMQTNTNSIDSLIAVDHYSFGSAGNLDGFHKQVTLPISSVIPTIAANQGSVYTKTVTTDTAHTESSLFYSPDTTGNEYQLTRTISTQFSTFSANVAYGTPPATFSQVGGWTFLPGGMLYQYGFFSKTGALGTSGTIQFPVPFLTFVSSINMTLYRNSGNQSLTLSSTTVPTLSNFSFLTSSAGSDGIFWFAIGK